MYSFGAITDMESSWPNPSSQPRPVFMLHRSARTCKQVFAALLINSISLLKEKMDAVTDAVIAWSLNAETSGMTSRQWATKIHPITAALLHNGLNGLNGLMLLERLPCARVLPPPRWLTLHLVCLVQKPQRVRIQRPRPRVRARMNGMTTGSI